MATSEPWRTLRRDHRSTLALLRNPAKQRFLVTVGRARAGVLVLDERAPLGGYVQAVCVAPAHRNRGLGTAMLRWAEARLFALQPNVFLCVSSFNLAAIRFYRRLGYRVAGRLRDYIVPGHDEILLRKTLGPLATTPPLRRRRRRN
jgi:ribosomal protein S18 acetylase RimI-like enzyme